jgi:DNA polymerase sigma
VDLLFGFFKLYGDQFDYVEHVISIADEGRYLNKTEKNWKNEKCPHLLSVEDPHNPGIPLSCFSLLSVM